MSNHTIIHLATHGAFVVGRPEESFILFGDGSRTNLKEVERTWKLDNVDLIVLSACETGVNGQFGKGQEILGFGYLMQLAGARASIASLWTVSDSGTQMLMETFYEILKQQPNMSKNEALQLAQQALINSKNNEININIPSKRGVTIQVTLKPGAKTKLKSSLSHPYYWSPFILIGNGL